MKFPIGIQSFDQIITDGYAYVDKTDLVYSLATEGKIYFLSRPRRFGKSLLLSTLENYFLGRRELFKGLKIDSLEKEWKTYPVFHIDFNGDPFTDGDRLKSTLEGYVAGWEAEYGVAPDINLSHGRRFAKVLKAARERTGMRCVVLVDEYDKPMLDVMGLDETVERNNTMVTLEDVNRETLKAFYSTFKLADADLQFVLLTGVTKFSQLSVFSGFNQPKDISMHPKYEAVCGITDSEIDSYLREPVGQMAEQAGCTYDEMREMLRQQYDGYHFSGRMTGVYNPFCLLNALDSGALDNYWFRSGTPTYLVRLLKDCDERITDLVGKYYEQDEFEDYRADSQRPLPMIYQSGYLTIKGYDREMRTFRLDYPNEEVKKGLVTILANSFLGDKVNSKAIIRRLVESLDRRNLKAFRDCFDSFLAGIPYSVRRKADERERERDFTYTLYLIFCLASCYVTYVEKQQSYGRLDCAIVTRDSAFVFEFKLDGKAEAAIAQIDEMGYTAEFRAPGRKVYKVGVSISSETGRIDDWKDVEEDLNIQPSGK